MTGPGSYPVGINYGCQVCRCLVYDFERWHWCLFIRPNMLWWATDVINLITYFAFFYSFCIILRDMKSSRNRRWLQNTGRDEYKTQEETSADHSIWTILTIDQWSIQIVTYIEYSLISGYRWVALSTLRRWVLKLVLGYPFSLSFRALVVGGVPNMQWSTPPPCSGSSSRG